MKKNNAFTLAEILIVLVVIGAIAAMALPSLMKGVTEAHWKASYRKAYNAISNLYTAEKTAGAVPSSTDKESIVTMFKALAAHLYTKDYATASQPENIASEALYDNSSYYSKFTFDSSSVDDSTLDASNTQTVSPWVITEDNMSYCVVAGDGCGTKEDINAAGSHNEAVKYSCVLVVVDVNGLNNGPNRVDPQITSVDALNSTKGVNTLSGDRFYVYVGLNGVTAGSKKSTVTGRIVANLD